MIIQGAVILLIPFLGTTLGSALVFFIDLIDAKPFISPHKCL